VLGPEVGAVGGPRGWEPRSTCPYPPYFAFPSSLYLQRPCKNSISGRDMLMRPQRLRC
jgi:hypothetical protein